MIALIQRVTRADVRIARKLPVKSVPDCWFFWVLSGMTTNKNQNA